MDTNVVKNLFEKFEGRIVEEIILQGGRGGSAVVATLGLTFSKSDEEQVTDVNLNFRRWYPGRIDFKEIGSEGNCLDNWTRVNGKEISDCFEQQGMYGTHAGYFESLKVSDLSVGKQFAFHHAEIDLCSSIERGRCDDEVRIMMTFIEVTKKVPDHFVCFHIPLDSETYPPLRKRVLLVPHIEEMRKGNLFSNSRDFELYFTEEKIVEAEQETRTLVVS